MAFFQTIINAICGGAAWVFGAAKRTTSLSPRTYQIWHLIVLLVIALIAGFFTEEICDFFGVNRGGSGFDVVDKYLCGWLVLVLYVLVRMILYVARLFGIQDSSEFPDLDRAWSEAMIQLGRQGLTLQSFPLFVVIGIPEDQERPFLMGAKFPAAATGPSPDSSQPLRIFANAKAAFLFVSGASAIVRQLTEGPRVAVGGGSSIATISSPSGIGSAGSMMTLSPGQMPAAEGSGDSGPSILGAMSTLAPRQSSSAVRRASDPGSAVPSAPLPSEALSETARRLRHVCRLVNSARKPFCGINGAVVVVPSQWGADGFPDFSHVVAQDVQVLHEGLEMLFPVACLFSGIESLGGLPELLTRAAEVNRTFSGELKAGSRYATGHPVDPESASWVTRHCVGWFRDWIYSAFKKDPSSGTNPRLYRLLSEISDRRRNFARILTAGFGQLVGGQSVRLLGVYFNGRDAQGRTQVFVKQLLDNILAEQDNVVWSPQRILRENSLRSWTYAVYGLIALLVMADLYWIIDRLR